ncbi:UvrD-helicase domain-containing protein [Flavobacterium sp.]|jgi:ATP-dependent exoDNAse (exonuclease V) beta subunit|uniref:UvrD-helicase domain-containing protein n=1 Tax=Flavobacterium sp. TaxID=239 RepID=UPI0037C03EAB
MTQNKPAFSLYDASAGSGKTYTLVKEYLKIILLSKKPDAYRSILAITFTNKAVHEMKSRVVESLTEFTKDKPSEKAIELMQVINAETSMSLQDIQVKAKSIIKNLIHNYAAFDISTIDKFTHRVIRTFAHDLNLPITFEVSLDTENLLTEAIDALIAQAGEDETLTNLLVEFTMQKTDEDKSWDVSREIMDTGRLILDENNREEIKHFNDKSISEFVEIKKKLQALSKEIEDETVEMADLAMRLINEKGIDVKSFSGGYLPKHIESIQNRKFKPDNKTYREPEDIKINKTAKDAAIIEGIIPDLLVVLEAIYIKFESRNFYDAFLKNITPLSLLNTVNNELAKIQKEQNLLSISEFNKLINDQIQNQPAPFIYERLGERYRHFFIDEFQDTSEMQWQNLIPLIDNALSSEDMQGERGSLLVVGDPKQSIYRWRGGKAEQFIELANGANPFVNPDWKPFSLDTNYRSYSEVIDFNNKFFNYLSGQFKNEDYKDLYENHSHQKENHKKGGLVSISFLPKVDEDEEDEENSDKFQMYLKATLAKIEEIKKNGFKNKDIVILTRKKNQGTAIANYLTENGVSVLSSESILIGASSEVQCVINFLRYLKNSNDQESKAQFLYYLAVNQQHNIPISDFITEGISLKKEKEFQDWLQQFDLNFSFEVCRKKSLYEATEIIISKVIPVAKRNAYIQYFLDIVLERDLKNQAGISDFLSYWNNNGDKLSIPSPEGNDAVRIMTIHKSKGLEFPVVILPFAEQDFSRGPREKMWLNADENEIGISKALVDKSSKVENYGADASQIYKQKKQEDILDIINVLYVSLTRAEEQLHVISAINIKKDGTLPSNLSSYFIGFLKDKGFDENKLVYEFGQPKKLSKEKEESKELLPIPQVLETLDPRSIKIAQRESIMWNTKQQNAIEYGNTIHEILSFIKTKNDVDSAITKAIENGLIVPTQKEEVAKTIHEIVNHIDLTAFFDEGGQVLNEQAIIQKGESIVKPDRMVLNSSKEIYLLDYKTGSHLPKHQVQLENYQKVIEEMGYKVVKKALIYIGENCNIVNL